MQSDLREDVLEHLSARILWAGSMLQITCGSSKQTERSVSASYYFDIIRNITGIHKIVLQYFPLKIFLKGLGRNMISSMLHLVLSYSELFIHFKW